MRRAVLITVVAGLLPAATAHGHAVVQPSSARPADPQVYRVTIPNEMESETVDVRLRVPAGIDFVLLEQAPPGWKGEIVRKGDVPSEIHWSGGAIPPEQYGTFRFLVRNPVEEGDITWPIVQRYEDGSVQRWIGPADSDEPASVTQISESATPQDIIAVGGEKVAEAKGSTPAAPVKAAAVKEEEDGEDVLDWVTLGLAAGGFALGGIALLRRRS
jgi:uncharacterized protein YcnI